MHSLLGNAGASAAQSLIASAAYIGKSRIATVIGVVTLLVGAWLARYFGEWHSSLLIIYVLLSLAIYTVLFALVYKYVPQERLHWRDVWVGGLVMAILFNIGKFAIGYYLGKSAFSSVYGAAGSLYSLVLGTRAGGPK
jgi:membrane protein